jgi:sugar lactone lactonase YvrE
MDVASARVTAAAGIGPFAVRDVAASIPFHRLSKMKKTSLRPEAVLLAGVLAACGSSTTSSNPDTGGALDASASDASGGDLAGVSDAATGSDAPADGTATSDGGADASATATLSVAFPFNNQMPTGVAVSREGRIFVNYPHWEDPIAYTVAELKNGVETPYPDQATNTPDNPDKLMSVQSVVIDPANRLWILDTGTINMGPPMGQFPKLVGIDLQTNQVFKTVHFPSDVVLATTYLNDVRFDLTRGSQGTAFITDSSQMGENAIIVVDLATGQSRRRLRDDPSTKSDPGFMAMVLGEPVEVRMPGMPPMPFRGNLDGIALTGDRLFYTPLTSHALYSVSLADLLDANQSDAALAATIQKETRTFASDGLFSDAEGHIYLTDWEHNAVWERSGPSRFVMLAQDTARMWWPDSLAMSSDGSLYVTANQLHRQRRFHDGQDLRQKPFFLFKFPGDGTPMTTPVPTSAP